MTSGPVRIVTFNRWHITMNLYAPDRKAGLAGRPGMARPGQTECNDLVIAESDKCTFRASGSAAAATRMGKRVQSARQN